MPKEYKLVLKHVDEAGYTSDIQCYLKHGGYKTLKKAFRVKPKKAKGSVVSPQEAIRKEVLASGLRGPGRRRFLVRHEVELRKPQVRQAGVSHLQR